ncbi:MAG: hypothetical protein JNM50_05710 [Chromatiales bacterium]|jgi:hypothetical protein|nr:hypothetical protein [Chromatiales bacterium]
MASRHLMVPLVATSLLAGCGGGGGDDEDDLSFLLTTYDYAITNPAGSPPGFIRTIITPGQPDDVYSINAGTGSARGALTLGSGAVTFTDTTTFTVTWSQGGPVPAHFSVGFTEGGSLASGNFLPVTGAYAVTWNGNTIAVDYGNTVAVQLNGGAPVSFAPFDFILLDGPGSSAPDWQRVAARAARAHGDLLGQVRNASAFLESIYDGELDSGQAAAACGTIPGMPPAGIPQVGEVVATDLGGGDYRTTGNSCFRQANPDRGALTTGTIDFRNLVVETDASGAIVRAGFEATGSGTGGVSFDTRLRLMTSSPSGSTWSFSGAEQHQDGGFSIVFTAPN